MRLAAVLFFSSMLHIFNLDWSVPDPADWRIEDNSTLALLVGKDPPASGPRRPFQFALANTPEYKRVHLEGDMKPLGRSLMIVYAYRDPAHFDYAHLSTDTALKEPHHNGIFHVYDGERVRISAPAGPPAFSSNKTWRHVVFDYDGGTGTVNVRVDGQIIPALKAVDLSLSEGKVGLGSFDETGEFKNVRISGESR